MEGVHLMDTNPAEPLSVGLDGVEDRDRLAVRKRHDQVGLVGDGVQDGLGGTCARAMEHGAASRGTPAFVLERHDAFASRHVGTKVPIRAGDRHC
jgi:hypothetical protein